MQIDPARYREIPENRHQIRAGCLLFPTKVPISAGAGSSLKFVLDQGGCAETFVLLLGQRRMSAPLGGELDVLEGVFLRPQGPGFRTTWGYHQLMEETDPGGWTVVPTPSVLSEHLERVETRINAVPS